MKITWNDHSFETFNAVCQENEELIIDLPEEIPMEAKSDEVAFYLNCHPDNQILINGLKATTFQLGDKIEIISKNKHIEMVFQAEGTFFGHLSKTNRPHRVTPPRFEALDWKIFLRTLQRSNNCQVKVFFKVIE